MLPSSLLVRTASFVLPLIGSSSAPVCVPSAEGYQVQTLKNLYNVFCEDLSKEDFAASREVYGIPVISLSFAPATDSGKCDANNCLTIYASLIKSCKYSPHFEPKLSQSDQCYKGQFNSHSIFGTGSIDAGCGTYNFTVWNTTLNPVGTVTNTINTAAATATPVLLNLASGTQLSSSVPTGKPSSTKPNVGSTALGTSDGAIVQISGCTLIGVVFAFAWFL